MLPAFYKTRKSIIMSNRAPRLPMSKVKFNPRYAISFLQNPAPSPAPRNLRTQHATVVQAQCKFVHINNMTTYGQMEVQLHSFLTPAQVGGDQLYALAA